MQYDVFYKASAVKELENLPKEAQRKIMETIHCLAAGDFLKVEKLSGHQHFYRSKRAWPYRILFTMEARTIRITNIGHRQGVYK